MKQIKEKIDKLPSIIRSIIYGITISTYIICLIMFLLFNIYCLYKLLLIPLAAIVGPVVSAFIIVWILMTLVISIVVFIESKR